MILSRLLFTLACLAPGAAALAAPGADECRYQRFEGNTFAVCAFDWRKHSIELHLRDEAGRPYGDFDRLSTALRANGRTLRFAMNGGMYQVDRRPVGLYISEGHGKGRLRTGGGYGNFYLRPNGVFLIDRNGPRVMETRAFARSRLKPLHATQSGPMLLLGGKLHPRFLPDSNSRKRRNGVGVSRDGKRVFFVLADSRVNFHAFARFFRDRLQVADALYLDGSISRLFAPQLRRNDPGAAMGPIIAVTAPAHDMNDKKTQ